MRKGRSETGPARTFAGLGRFVRAKLSAILILLAAGAVVVLAALFVNSYLHLSRTIENERFTYVDELQTQLLERMDLERQMQLSLLRNLAGSLSAVLPDSFAQLSGVDPDEEEGLFLLVSNTGAVYDLEGRLHVLSNPEIPRHLLHGETELYACSVLDGAQEYWLCGIPVDSFSLDGSSFSALLRARPIDQFAETMTVSMFDNQGFSFIVDQNGAAVMAPETNGLMGYNLLRSMERLGLEQSVSDEIAQDLLDGASNQKYVEFDGARWLLKYSTQSYEEWITVILMPVSITGADTYHVLSRTMRELLLLVSGTLVLAGLIISNYFIREQRRVRRESEMQVHLAHSTAQAKSDFLAKMSHDIRTPLNAITGTLYLANENRNDAEQVKKYIDICQESAGYLLSLLNDILDMSKIESGKLELHAGAVDLAQTLERIRAMNTQAQDKGVLFSVTGTEEIACGYSGDSLRLNQVLMNLVSNSIKFTAPGGRVTLHVGVETLDEARDTVAFSLEDTGIGMSEAFVEKLFTPFVQEDSSITNIYGGSGLGLSIVRSLVDLMGGTVRAASKKGVGSRFEVRLPMARLDGPAVPTAPAAQPDGADDSYLRGRRVLLVEDNELNTMIAKKILTSVFQLEVDTAADGQQAVDALARCEPGYYDLVFMDVFMPVMDGLTAARNIRKLPSPYAARVPIVCMSANAFDEDVKNALASGMNDYLAKPLDIERLKAVLLAYIRREEETS